MPLVSLRPRAKSTAGPGPGPCLATRSPDLVSCAEAALAVLAQRPVRIVRDLPGMALGIDEDACFGPMSTTCDSPESGVGSVTKSPLSQKGDRPPLSRKETIMSDGSA